MAFLGDLLIRLKAETADFTSDLGKAAHESVKAMQKMERGAGKLNAALATIGGSLSLGGIIAIGKATINSADDMGKMAQKLGTTSEALSAFSYAAKLADVSQESLQVGVKKLSSAMLESAAGSREQVALFKALGISATDGSGKLKSTQDVMLELSDKFSNMKDSAEKSALAVKFFGKSGLELIPFLNMGRRGITELMEEAERLGIVITTQTAKGAEEFNDNLKRTSEQTRGIAVQFMSSLLPLLLDVQKHMLDSGMAAGSFKNEMLGIAKSRDTVESWAENTATVFAHVGDAISRAYDVIAQAVESTATVVMQSLSFIAKAAKATPQGAIANKMTGALDAIIQYEETWSAKADANLRARAQRWGTEMSMAQKVENYFAARKKRLALEHIYGPGGGSNKPTGGVDPSMLKPKGLTDEQKEKMFISQMQAMTKQIYQLNGAGQAQLMIYETTVGTLRVLDPEQKKQLVNKAQELDVLTRLIEVRGAYQKALQDEAALREKVNTIATEQVLNDAKQLDDMKFQLSLIGMSAREQERMNAARQIDLDLRKQLASLPPLDEGLRPEVYAERQREVDQMKKRAAEQKTAVLESVNARQAAERNWLTGAKNAFHEYMDSGTNAAKMTQDLFTKAFQGLEDALVKFATTGKISFKELATSIIGDLVRIQAKAAITNLLGAMMGSSGYDSSGNPSGGGTNWMGLLKIGMAAFGGFSGGAGAGANLATADGGYRAAGQSLLVGEQGPELFVPTGAGKVIPNDMLGGGGNVNITFNVNSLDPRTAASVLAENKDVITGIVRGAINERGRRADF